MQADLRTRYLWVVVFAAAFAFVEASVVVYLRTIYYPGGFDFPLKQIQHGHLVVELLREAATILMLGAVAFVAGNGRWERFCLFLVAFGLWDMLFYLWLKVILGWPETLTDWDILFLLPIPWIGPVIAPLLIAFLMAIGGTGVLLRIAGGGPFHPGPRSWLSGLAGTAVLLVSFTTDTSASLGGAMPRPYRYELLAGGLLLWTFSLVAALVPSRRPPT